MKERFEFGPFQVTVDTSLGDLPRPWGGQNLPHYLLLLQDGHGHFFEAAWADVDREGPEAIAQRLVILLENAQEEVDFAKAFSEGYGREERRWRYREATRIKEAVQDFLPAEVTKAAAIATKKLNYRMFKGPRDWSPIEELPDV